VSLSNIVTNAVLYQ